MKLICFINKRLTSWLSRNFSTNPKYTLWETTTLFDLVFLLFSWLYIFMNNDFLHKPLTSHTQNYLKNTNVMFVLHYYSLKKFFLTKIKKNSLFFQDRRPAAGRSAAGPGPDFGPNPNRPRAGPRPVLVFKKSCLVKEKNFVLKRLRQNIKNPSSISLRNDILYITVQKLY